jgi:response regulator RpfG family c-di-GMP phosphodiesterase
VSAFENYKEEAGMYDLLILDMKMPQMNGFELYRQIKKKDDKAKVFTFLVAVKCYCCTFCHTGTDYDFLESRSSAV